MNGCDRGADCRTCLMYGGPFICHCLRVREEDLAAVLQTLEVRTVREVRRITGAGDGCTACQSRIQSYIDSYSSASSTALTVVG